MDSARVSLKLGQNGVHRPTGCRTKQIPTAEGRGTQKHSACEGPDGYQPSCGALSAVLGGFETERKETEGRTGDAKLLGAGSDVLIRTCI